MPLSFLERGEELRACGGRWVRGTAGTFVILSGRPPRHLLARGDGRPEGSSRRMGRSRSAAARRMPWTGRRTSAARKARAATWGCPYEASVGLGARRDGARREYVQHGAKPATGVMNHAPTVQRTTPSPPTSRQIRSAPPLPITRGAPSPVIGRGGRGVRATVSPDTPCAYGYCAPAARGAQILCIVHAEKWTL